MTARPLDFRPPRILPSTKASRDRARLVINVLVTDSLRDRKELAKQWRRAKVAGDLVTVRQFTRKVKAAGAAVELHLVVISLRPRSTPPAVAL